MKSVNLKSVAIAGVLLISVSYAMAEGGGDSYCPSTVNQCGQSNCSADEASSLPTTRSGWLKLDYALSKKAFAGMSGAQKADFWIDKVDETLNLDWQPKEREHILLLRKWIEDNRQLFDKDNEDKLDAFCRNWVETAVSQLGWSKQIPYAIIVCGNKLQNTKGDIVPLKGENCKACMRVCPE